MRRQDQTKSTASSGSESCSPRPSAVVKAFEAVRVAARRLPHVEAGTRYDGSPVLRLHGCFMAALASHPSAEPDTLVVRIDLEDRDALIEDAPETYYLTDHYRRHPVVLARLARLDPVALHDLLSISWRLTAAKTKKRLR